MRLMGIESFGISEAIDADEPLLPNADLVVESKPRYYDPLPEDDDVDMMSGRQPNAYDDEDERCHSPL